VRRGRAAGNAAQTPARSTLLTERGEFGPDVGVRRLKLRLVREAGSSTSATDRYNCIFGYGMSTNSGTGPRVAAGRSVCGLALIAEDAWSFRFRESGCDKRRFAQVCRHRHTAWPVRDSESDRRWRDGGGL
jgi:hypothetical protein